MTELDITETLFLLRDQRRRFVIETLDSVETIGLSELADRVAAKEFGDGYTDNERKTCYVSLKQTHIEALADADVIVYRDLAGVVIPGQNYGELREVLNAIRETLDDEDAVDTDGGDIATVTESQRGG